MNRDMKQLLIGIALIAVLWVALYGVLLADGTLGPPPWVLGGER